MRLFVALDLDDRTRLAVHEAAAPLRAAVPALGWIPAERLHFTLKFLREVGAESVPPLVAALDDAAARHRAFVLGLRDVGAFPNFRKPRVVWAGVQPDPRLELLQHDVEARCAALGYEVEGRPFRPHLTLARVKGPIPAGPLRALADAARGLTFEDEVDVESIDLMHSTLSSAGPRYVRLHAAPLVPAER